MSPRNCFLVAILLLGLTVTVGHAQQFPCGAGGGTNCRELIPDRDNTSAVVTSTLAVNAGGPCLTLPVGRVAARVKVLHDWAFEVGLSLSNPAGTVATLRTGIVRSGYYYPDQDFRQLFIAPTLIGGSAAGNWTLRANDVSRSGYGALDDWSLYLVCGPVPAVSVTAPSPVAIERPVVSGAFRVARSVVTDSPLDVALLLGGTAAATDYAPIPLVVTIPAGQAAVDVPVTPIPDAVTEGQETVVMSITDPALYETGAPSSATVMLLDEYQAIPTLDILGLVALGVLLALLGALVLRSR
jgi:subtilisin-like proprotein convertase family protein